MIMALMVTATAYVVDSYEFNADGFQALALNRAAKFARRDHWTNLPMVSADDSDLEIFQLNGETVCKGAVSVRATVDDIDNANKVLNEFIVAAMNFNFDIGFQIVGKLLP